MKLATFSHDGKPGYGLVVEEGILTATQAFRADYADLRAALRAGAAHLLPDNVDVVPLPLSAVQFLPPVPNPDKILCIGVNYGAHIVEMGRTPPDYPVVFTRFARSLVGHQESLLRPLASRQYDFEGELAIVIGKRARHVAREQALDYVAGYSCFMDGSVRDWQNHGSQFTPGKNFKASGSFGPWLVTADEIPDPNVLKLATRLNGKVMQQAPISDLKFDIPDTKPDGDWGQ